MSESLIIHIAYENLSRLITELINFMQDKNGLSGLEDDSVEGREITIATLCLWVRLVRMRRTVQENPEEWIVHRFGVG